MKVAFASSNGTLIDQNFRKARVFTVWDVGPDESYHAHTVSVTDDVGNVDDRIDRRIEAMAGCAMVCAREINGPATARLVSRHVHPLRIRAETSVETIIQRLQKVLQDNPAPWLLKAHLRDRRVWPERDPCASLLDVTVADLLDRCAEAVSILMGSGFAVFIREQQLLEGGVMMTIREALKLRGISEDLFLVVLGRHMPGLKPEALCK